MLIETLGEDAGQLAAAAQQLAGAFAGRRVTPAEVRQQFRGLGEQKTWDLCDRAFGKDLPGAIRSLRSIEENGDEALMVLGGIAARLRDLIRVRALPDRLPLGPGRASRRASGSIGRHAAISNRRGNFTMEELVALHGRIAETDGR